MLEATPPSQKPIGDVGEDFVEYLCSIPFGRDFLFRGQMYRTEDGDVELCDLLLLLDDVAVLIEVKTAQRDKKQDWSDEQWADWANKRLERAISQVERGCTALLTGKVAHIENERQGRIAVVPSKIKFVYGVAVVDHPPLDKWGNGPILSIQGRRVSVLTTTHQELDHLLTELSTPGDFVDYMRAREAFFVNNKLMGISELDLLAVYKVDPERFNRQVAGEDILIMIDDGCWSEYAKLDARTNRQELDKYSYVVDAMLSILHEARHAALPHVQERRRDLGQPADGGDSYHVVATELARLRRMDRRLIGNKLFEKSQKCVEQKRDRWFISEGKFRGGPPFVFLVSTDNREARMKWLESITWGGKLKTEARRIVGIATEPITGGYGSSVDAVMFDTDPAADRANMPLELQKDLLSQFGTPKHVVDTEFGDPPAAA